MPLQIRNPPVLTCYALEGGKLTFRTDAPLVVHEARHAMVAGRNLTFHLSSDDKEVNGKVLLVELIAGVTPTEWDVVIRLSA